MRQYEKQLKVDIEAKDQNLKTKSIEISSKKETKTGWFSTPYLLTRYFLNIIVHTR